MEAERPTRAALKRIIKRAGLVYDDCRSREELEYRAQTALDLEARCHAWAPRAGLPAVAAWEDLAEGVSTESEVRALFALRQPRHIGQPLEIESATKVVNQRALGSFVSSRSLYLDEPMRATSSGDTILFHGTPEACVGNVQAFGRPTMEFASGGMLGRGIYGAPDPRKSAQYSRLSRYGRFIFVCRFNLEGQHLHAGPRTGHRNTVFDEFCVFDDAHVVALWVLKLKTAEAAAFDDAATLLPSPRRNHAGRPYPHIESSRKEHEDHPGTPKSTPGAPPATATSARERARLELHGSPSPIYAWRG